MFVMKKTMLAAVILSGVCMNVAHATLPSTVNLVGDGVSASADLVFSEGAGISNTLVPFKATLTSGSYKDGTEIARGIVHALDGQSHLYAITFGDTATNKTFVGKNDSSHKLTVALSGGDLGAKAMQHISDDGKYLQIGAHSDMSKGLKTSQYEIVTFGEQSVPADTYTISTVAYVYTS